MGQKTSAVQYIPKKYVGQWCFKSLNFYVNKYKNVQIGKQSWEKTKNLVGF